MTSRNACCDVDGARNIWPSLELRRPLFLRLTIVTEARTDKNWADERLWTPCGTFWRHHACRATEHRLRMDSSRWALCVAAGWIYLSDGWQPTTVLLSYASNSSSASFRIYIIISCGRAHRRTRWNDRATWREEDRNNMPFLINYGSQWFPSMVPWLLAPQLLKSWRGEAFRCGSTALHSHYPWGRLY